MAEQPDRMHQTRLKSLYRVCGCSLKHSRTVYDSKNHKDDLLAAFHIDITRDSNRVERLLCVVKEHHLRIDPDIHTRTL